MDMKRLMLAGMIAGLLGAGTAYAGPGFDVSVGAKWIQNVSDEESEGGEDQGNPGGEEGQEGSQEEGEPSSEGQEEPST